MMNVKLELPDQEGQIEILPGQYLEKVEEMLIQHYGKERKILFCLQSPRYMGHYCLIIHKMPLVRLVDILYVEIVDRKYYNSNIVRVSVRDSANYQLQQQLEVDVKAQMYYVDILYKAYTGQDHTNFRYHLLNDMAKRELPLYQLISTIPRQTDSLIIIATSVSAFVEVLENNESQTIVEVPLETLHENTAKQLYQKCWYLFEVKPFSELCDYWFEYKAERVNRERPVNAEIGDRVKLQVKRFTEPRMIVLRDEQGLEIARKIFEKSTINFFTLEELYSTIMHGKGTMNNFTIQTPKGVLKNKDFLNLNILTDTEITLVASFSKEFVGAEPERPRLGSVHSVYSNSSYSNKGPGQQPTPPAPKKTLSFQILQPIIVGDTPADKLIRIKAEMKELLNSETQQNSVQTTTRLRELAYLLLNLEL